MPTPRKIPLKKQGPRKKATKGPPKRTWSKIREKLPAQKRAQIERAAKAHHPGHVEKAVRFFEKEVKKRGPNDPGLAAAKKKYLDWLMVRHEQKRGQKPFMINDLRNLNPRTLGTPAKPGKPLVLTIPKSTRKAPEQEAKQEKPPVKKATKKLSRRDFLLGAVTGAAGTALVLGGKRGTNAARSQKRDGEARTKEDLAPKASELRAQSVRNPVWWAIHDYGLSPQNMRWVNTIADRTQEKGPENVMSTLLACRNVKNLPAQKQSQHVLVEHHGAPELVVRWLSQPSNWQSTLDIRRKLRKLE